MENKSLNVLKNGIASMRYILERMDESIDAIKNTEEDVNAKTAAPPAIVENDVLRVYSAETALQVAKETLETTIAIINARIGFETNYTISNPFIHNENTYYHVGSITQINGHWCYASITIERLDTTPECVYPQVGFYAPELSEKIIPMPIQNPKPIQIVEALLYMFEEIKKSNPKGN